MTREIAPVKANRSFEEFILKVLSEEILGFCFEIVSSDHRPDHPSI